jgi:hypothetical protein
VFHTGAELGLPELIGYVAIWGRALVGMLRRSSLSTSGATALAMHAMPVTFLLHSQSEHFLANLAASFRFLLVAGVIVGLAEAARAIRR